MYLSTTPTFTFAVAGGTKRTVEGFMFVTPTPATLDAVRDEMRVRAWDERELAYQTRRTTDVVKDLLAGRRVSAKFLASVEALLGIDAEILP
jgi:hypothetical protein